MRNAIRPQHAQKAWDNPKKKQCTYREASAESRARFNARIKRVPPEKRVYMDESGISEYPRRAPHGEKVSDVKQGKRFSRVNVTGALYAALHICVECYRHATNAEFFEDWFENRLLQAIPWGEGYTVILDNARFHRRDALRRLARGKVRLLFLPAYSPDYNYKGKPPALLGDSQCLTFAEI